MFSLLFSGFSLALLPIGINVEQSEDIEMVSSQIADDPFETGQSFVTQCRRAIGNDGVGEIFGLCVGFVEGVLIRDGYPPPNLICVPDGTSRIAVMEGLLGELEAGAELLQMSGRRAVVIAFARAFPSNDVSRDTCFEPWEA